MYQAQEILIPIAAMAMVFGIVYLGVTAHNRKTLAMIEAGMSVAGKVTCETKIRDIEDHIVIWPMKDVE